MESAQRRPLIVMQSAPYRGSLARAALDVALSYAVFSQHPGILFSGDAVLGLIADQQPETLGRKSLRKVIDSMPLYDIDEIYVDGDALDSHGVPRSKLPEFARILGPAELRSLTEQASHVLSL
jgi:tRNA 2-thiouridine synthesizing protein C